jgi:peptidyl-prolyl cis-trans isomerase A (cyclophilin A)
MLTCPERTAPTPSSARCFALLVCLALTACGGGSSSSSSNGSQAIPSSANRQAPEVRAQALDLDDSGQALITTSEQGLPQMRLTVTGWDDTDVTGYCLTETSAAPRASDGCFSDSRSRELRIGPAWRAWARDGAGNVSEGALSPGPCSAPAYAASDASSLPTVCMMTDRGEIVLELEDKKAVNTVRNFLDYVREGYYSGTVFHRVLAGSVLQGGGFTRLEDVPTNTGKPVSRSAISLEKTTDTGLSNLEKTIAMARTNEPNSATSQFFINLRNNASSYDASTGNEGYAVFGRVIYGYETAVLRLAAVPLVGDRPQQALNLRWAYVMK